MHSKNACSLLSSALHPKGQNSVNISVFQVFNRRETGNLITLIFVKSLHELGHGYIAKYFGCRVSAIGIAFLVFFPFLYTDTTDAWRLRNHRERLIINFAGILTELHLALIATFLWAILPDGGLKSVTFFIATTSWISSLAINVSPFMRFDGYYVFSDWLKAEILQPRSFAYSIACPIPSLKVLYCFFASIIAAG